MKRSRARWKRSCGVMLVNIEEFRERIQTQKDLELLAEHTYSEFAAVTKGKYRDMFVEIEGQERHHAQLCDEILALLE